MKTNKKQISIYIGILLIGGLIGYVLSPSSADKDMAKHEHTDTAKQQIWTCAMHPQIRKTDPGKCPICGMDLVPLNREASDANPLEIQMSPTAMQLANIQTAIVKKQKPIKEVRMNGKVQANERNVYSQSTHIPGRIEKLMVNFTGESVQKGQILAYVYSPELQTTQEELLEAYKIKDSQPGLYQAAREKLKNWKLSDQQINQLIESGKARDQFPIMADVSGIVMNKKVNLGDYIQRGQSLYEIANLSTIWVVLDVYESDIQWVKSGDKVQFTVQSMPGEIFNGKVSFIDPVIDSKTRVASARLEMNNPGLRLKPEMFVEGKIESPIQNQKEALIVPKSAVMWTGERSVVYIKNTNSKGISFIMRQVTLGATLGDSYIIKEGLSEGEEIATNGTFSIDAAAQLAGKPSMMNPEGNAISTEHNRGENKKSIKTDKSLGSKKISISQKAKDELKPLLENYLLMKDALVLDDFEKSKTLLNKMAVALGQINMVVFTGEAHSAWMIHSSKLNKDLKTATKAQNIGLLRAAFNDISDEMILLVKTFGSFGTPVYVEHCPMANSNKGADWLSAEKEINNPYFGESMLKCGEVKLEIR